MNRWTEILDHGDDPGRYTLIDGRGNVTTCNENGSIVAQRKCRNPYKLVADLCREPGIKIVKPAQQTELLKKINQDIIKKSQSVVQQTKPDAIPDYIRDKLIAWAKTEWPQADSYTARMSWQGNYVVRVSNDYPLQHGGSIEKVFTPNQIHLLK